MLLGPKLKLPHIEACGFGEAGGELALGAGTGAGAGAETFGGSALGLATGGFDSVSLPKSGAAGPDTVRCGRKSTCGRKTGGGGRCFPGAGEGSGELSALRRSICSSRFRSSSRFFRACSSKKSSSVSMVVNDGRTPSVRALTFSISSWLSSQSSSRSFFA